MAKFDYYGLETELQYILQSDSTLDGVKVIVEESPIFADESPIIAIYLESRTPSENQYISAGTIQQYNLQMAIWVFVFGAELPAIIQQRDDLLGKLEVALMGNTTINGKARDIQLQGGDMLPASKAENAGLIVGAETRVMVDIVFTT